MSVPATFLDRPAHRRHAAPSELGDEVVLAFARAEEVAAGLASVVELLQLDEDVDRVEWWAPAESGDLLRLEAAAGTGGAERTAVPLGPVGVLVLAGPGWAPRIVEAVVRLVPLVRRRWTEERLARHATLLARRIEALEDFAALVAHELKGPLHASLLAGDTQRGVTTALELVDSLLEVVRSERDAGASARPAACLDAALRDLGDAAVTVTASLPEAFPMPRDAQRLVFRNLLSNAIAAGAQRVRVSAFTTIATASLVVDDDGAGLEARDRYATGNRLGFGLCSRLVARLGGTLDLRPRAGGGTRAVVEVPWETR
ncbi:MAG TPA: HAMP domain-containing sensor histidine kinase [Gaiellaceae bacterium]|nr:HAMP domain-containing sensor histidine kinase [Gaiellaceae bacterium]